MSRAIYTIIGWDKNKEESLFPADSLIHTKMKQRRQVRSDYSRTDRERYGAAGLARHLRGTLCQYRHGHHLRARQIRLGARS